MFSNRRAQFKSLLERTPYWNANFISFDEVLPRKDTDWSTEIGAKRRKIDIDKAVKAGDLYDKAREASEKSGALKQADVDELIKDAELLQTERDLKKNIGKTQEEVDKARLRQQKLQALQRANELLMDLQGGQMPNLEPFQDYAEYREPSQRSDIYGYVPGAGFGGVVDEEVDENTQVMRMLYDLYETGAVRDQNGSLVDSISGQPLPEPYSPAYNNAIRRMYRRLAPSDVSDGVSDVSGLYVPSPRVPVVLGPRSTSSRSGRPSVSPLANPVQSVADLQGPQFGFRNFRSEESPSAESRARQDALHRQLFGDEGEGAASSSAFRPVVHEYQYATTPVSARTRSQSRRR